MPFNKPGRNRLFAKPGKVEHGEMFPLQGKLIIQNCQENRVFEIYWHFVKLGFKTQLNKMLLIESYHIYVTIVNINTI